LFLTAAIATASFMEILDMTIVNVSVPAISGSLGVSNVGGHLGGQFLHAGGGRDAAADRLIGRRFGEVRTFVTSILLFMCFSAVCGLATTCRCLVGARLIQGWYPVP